VAVLACAEQLPVKVYTTADGLPRNYVGCIVQDTHGYLWFCTLEGLSRFDGYQFTNYGIDQGLPHRIVDDMVEMRDGSYWLATDGGLARLDPHASSGPKIRVYHPPGAVGPLAVTALLRDRAGNLWVGRSGDVYRIESKSGLNSSAQAVFAKVEVGIPKKLWPDRINAMLEDRTGAIWLATGEGLYQHLPDGQVRFYTVRDGLPGRNATSLLEDREGRVWVGTTDGLGRLVANPLPGRPIVSNIFTTRDGLKSQRVEALLQASDGTLWVGTFGGLSRFLRDAGADGSHFRNYSTEHGLSDASIKSLAEDREGNLWLGTERGGIVKIVRSGFRSYTNVDGLATNGIGAIFETRAGELCAVSTPAPLGINRFTNSRFTAIPIHYPKYITRYGWGWDQLLLEDHNREWWVPTGQGLCRYAPVERLEELASHNPSRVYTVRDGLPNDEIFRLFEDSRGDIWITTMAQARAVVRWERATDSFHSYSEADGIPIRAGGPTAFREDRSGILWLGFYFGGVARYIHGGFQFFTSADGAPEGFVRKIHLDHAGRLWIASAGGGVSRVDDPGTDKPRFVTYTSHQGLSGNVILSITEDRWGRLYLSTGQGVDRLDPETGRVKHFTTADGLVKGEHAVSYCDQHGTLWFGTSHGLSSLVPEPDQPSTPPPVRISRLSIAGAAYNISELGETRVSGIRLASNQNQVRIDFLGLGFGPGESLRYQYRLDGTDEDWSPLTDQRTVNFANLASNTYRFLVRAVNADGAVTQEPARVEFTILPPFWQRWWFIGVATLAVASLVYAAHRYRVARLLELERVRMRIATDLHDDIGSSLSQIAILSEVASRGVVGERPAVTGPLADIAGMSRELVDSMSDIVWAIDPQHDSAQDLSQRMRRFASDVFTARQMSLDFRVSGAEQSPSLRADLRRELFLVFKEAVNNVVRHSGATHVEAQLTIQSGRLLLSLCDDGNGFDIAAATPGNGLKNMRSRAMHLEGVLDISSASGHGTAIRLEIPLERRFQSWKQALHKWVGTNGPVLR
jgi:ligand-binding sensor domain-containing protein/signal transduction histidine kinase